MKKNKFFIILIVLITVVFVSGCGKSQEQTQADVSIQDAWARPANQGDNGAAFFTIQSKGDDTLLSAESSVAQAVELHKTEMEGEVMKMMPQTEGVQIPSGTTEFKPGGLHVMLINLKQKLVLGETFDLTLNFKNAGPKTIQVTIQQ